MKHSVSSAFHLTSSTSITCPVTGIAMEVNIPNMGIDFTFYSPFVKFANIQKLAEQPTQKLKELPSSILSGILLGTLHHYGMAESHEIEAWEANIYIQNCSKHEIISAIRFLSNIPSSSREILPSLSLHSFKETVQYSSGNNIINTYIKTCRDIINPPADENVSILSSSSDSGVKKTKEIKKYKKLSSEERTKIKELIAEISTDVLATSKLINILKIMAQKENIYNTAQETKEKIVKRLEELQSSASLELADIIKRATPSLAMQEDMDFSRASDTFAIVKTRKSLSEILAAKKAKALIDANPAMFSHDINPVIDNTEDASVDQDAVEDNSDEF